MLAVFSLEMSEVALGLGAAALLPAVVLWLIMRARAQKTQAEHLAQAEKNRAEAAAAHRALQAAADAQVAEAKKTAQETAAKLAEVEQRFATHREVADRRQTNDSQEIARLEADLGATREVAAQLAPTQARIKDVETALAAEQGRVKAQEQAIEAMSARAGDFEKRMIEAQELLMKHKTERREMESELKKIRDEQAAYAAAGGPEAELAKAREANQQLEGKITNLQRVLKAAEARVEMVQKEFMNAVGMSPAPSATAPTATDKKVRELEEKLTQLEAESRKRAREDGYKIAELEYRLSEALEAAAPPAAAKPEEPEGKSVPDTKTAEPAQESQEVPPAAEVAAESKAEEPEVKPSPADSQEGEAKVSADRAAAKSPGLTKRVVQAPATPKPAVSRPGELPLGDPAG